MKPIKQIVILSVLFAACTVAFCADKKAPKGYSEFSIDAEKNFLLLPMNGHDNYRKVRLVDETNNTVVGEYDALLASDPQWYAEIDISGLKGRKLSFQYETQGKPVAPIAPILQSDTSEIRNYKKDRARPAFHLSPKNGWLGDIYGLVYFGGMWHAFYQSNPFSMTPQAPYRWDHAVSKDLVEWDYLPTVMFPKFAGGRIDYPISANAYYDKTNKSGLFRTANGGVIFMYTSSLRGDCLLISEDLVNFSEVSFNPILKGESKGGRIFYNEDSGLWTIVRMEELEAKDEKGNMTGRVMVHAIYVSKNMKNWERTDEIDGNFAQAQLVKMPITGVNGDPKWVLFDGTGKYIVGNFDGRKFGKISSSPRRIFYGDARAAQIWCNASDNRIIASAWIQQPGDLMRDVGQAFSQSMSLPWQLNLVYVREGEFQLRAYSPSEFADRIGLGINAMGEASQMAFNTNIFTMPDAVGNKYLVSGSINTEGASRIVIEAGSASFAYGLYGSDKFDTARFTKLKSSDPAQVKYGRRILDFDLYVDTYSVELYIVPGEAVLFSGDSFINPDQQIKIGGTGQVVINSLQKFPIMRKDWNSRLSGWKKRFDNILEKGKK